MWHAHTTLPVVQMCMVKRLGGCIVTQCVHAVQISSLQTTVCYAKLACWVQHDYKGFSPGLTMETVTEEDWQAAPALQETPVTSAICDPVNGAQLEEGTEQVSGQCSTSSPVRTPSALVVCLFLIFSSGKGSAHYTLASTCEPLLLACLVLLVNAKKHWLELVCASCSSGRAGAICLCPLKLSKYR